MKQIKILAIGNSFSEDATYYLHNIAKSDGIDTKVVNLYIGGCSLEKHWKNVEGDKKLYLYQLNGEVTDKYVSIKDALLEEEWDFVITQQASHDSGLMETYFPYVDNLFEYIKKLAPKAKRLLQQTWAYEIDSTHDCFGRYSHNQKEMYEKICRAYRCAADEVGASIIPCGDVIQKLRTKEPFLYSQGGMSICRDGYHMNYIYGRYLLAATWYETIFKKDIINNKYIPETKFAPDEVVDMYKLNLIKECVHNVIECKNKKLMESSELKELMDELFYNSMKNQKKNKVNSYKLLNKYVKKGQILFVGSSLMEFFPINEMQHVAKKEHIIYNRGISGYVTTELLDSMEECIFELEPSKIFINIGTNDISSSDYKKEKLIENYNEILNQIHKRLPQCEVYVMAYYPINAKADFPEVDKADKEAMFMNRTNAAIMEANVAVEDLAKKHGYKFINVNEGLMDDEGNLKKEYAIEGLHMWPNAYAVILDNMKKYL